MNFLFILTTFYPNVGGVETASLEICKRLVAKAHQVHVITTNKANFSPNAQKLSRFEKKDGINIYRTPYIFRWAGLFLKTLLLIKKCRIDYLYVTDLWGAIALFMKKVFHIPFVYVLNGYNPICPSGLMDPAKECHGFRLVRCWRSCRKLSLRFLISIWMTRLLLLEGQRLIAVSNSVRDAFRRYFGELLIEVIYYGVDSEKFRPETVDRFIAHRKFAKSDKIILFFGRLIEGRGILEFLDWGSELFINPSTYCVIVGKGPLIRDVKLKMREKGLQKKVILPGWLVNRDLSRAINLADVIILPICFPEPFGLVVLEAMSCGKPVVSFKLGGVIEILEHGKTGYLIPPNDWKGFINQVQELLDDSHLMATIGEAARQKVEKTFRWDHFIDVFLKKIKQSS